MIIEEVALSKLRKTKILRRKHPKDQIEKCIQSVMTYGQYAPLVVSGNEILCGTLVYDVLKRLKMHKAKIVQLGELSKEKKKELRYLDNRTFEMSFWKEEELKVFLMSLDKEKLRDCGFSEDETENYINGFVDEGKREKKKLIEKDTMSDTWFCPDCGWSGTIEEK